MEQTGFTIAELEVEYAEPEPGTPGSRQIRITNATASPGMFATI